MRTNRHFWTAVIAAWLVFIGIDFVFHASLLSNMWVEEGSALKSETELFQLIPFGYASFLLLIMLIAFLYNAIFRDAPTHKMVLGFGIVFGGLFSISNLLGLYSYINLPLNTLILINLVYFIEILASIYIIYKTSIHPKPSRMIIFGVIFFLLCLVAGVIFQNV